MNSQEIATTLLDIMHSNMLYEAKVVGPVEPIVIHDAFLRFVEQYQGYRIFIMDQGPKEFGGVQTLHIDPLVVAKSITPHEILSFTQALQGFNYKDFNPVGQYRHHHPIVTPQGVFGCEYEGHGPAPDIEFVLFLYSDGSLWGVWDEDYTQMFEVLGGMEGLIAGITSSPPRNFRGRHFILP